MIKVSELKDERLDYWVAKAVGRDGEFHGSIYQSDEDENDDWYIYSPSTDWSQGGPIIESEDISLVGCVDWSEKPPRIDQYSAVMFQKDPEVRAWGKTHLIAAMRAYVASKFGEEVDDSQAHNL